MGTVWPPEIRAAIEARDGGYCVGARAGFPARVLQACVGQPVEIDHVRSGGMGMKSPSTVDNGVCLDAWCHRWKTENGRTARPLLIEYLANASGCTHVDPVFGCPFCDSRVAV